MIQRKILGNSLPGAAAKEIIMRIGIAIDFGTSGFRAQAVNIDQKGMILSTAVTCRHPIPGRNVIDHLDFAIRLGLERAQRIMIKAVNRLIGNLICNKQKISRLAVCGNSIQLSIFQGIEIRDLAYAGKSKLKSLGIIAPNRDSTMLYAIDINGLNLPRKTQILIPPAVFHEVGADTIAMIIQSGFMQNDEISIATDYGTNAEMALKVGNKIFTGSTAAGPAIEGQQLESGMMALPGAICDVKFEQESGNFNTWVLDKNLVAALGDTVNPITGEILKKGIIESLGITGTGVAALLDQGQKAGIIRLPCIDTPDKSIKLSKCIRFTESDLLQSGRAIGAFKAGHNALCHFAGIDIQEVKNAYLCGAAGTYTDPIKARRLGFYPNNAKFVYQTGNTSLAMARDLIWDDTQLEKMQNIADEIRPHHCMFASSRIFSKLYMLELSYWTEGMPKKRYNDFLRRYGFSNSGDIFANPKIIQPKNNDLGDIGKKGIRIVTFQSDFAMVTLKGCTGCIACIEACPEGAIQLKVKLGNHAMKIDFAFCNGTTCRKCEKACTENILKYKEFLR
ncbi:MAG: methylamine methyltransferase corrinoid protein reductive activase [Desulfobacteraceae bacterium]|nr:methylamine methyltransferase corrinoid protein reductive activase [Desulfobacteraceae bacterium]